MSDNNPYETPVSDLADEVSSNFPLHEARTVGAGRGVAWLGEGFEFFKRSPGPWVLTCIVGFILMVVISILPIINMLMGILTYVWIGGLMLGLKAQHDGEDFNVSYLFAGFKNSFGGLVLLGLLFFVIMMAVMMVTLGSMFMQMFSGGGNPDAIASNPMGFVLSMLIALAVMLPVYMAFWFAPLLIVIHEVPIVEALRDRPSNGV